MFKPMLHGQNRLSKIIKSPTEVPVYPAGNFVWLDSVNFVSFSVAQPNYARYYLNNANSGDNQFSAELGVPTTTGGRPYVEFNYASTGGENASRFADGDGTNAIQCFNSITTPEYDPLEYTQGTYFFVLRYDTAKMKTTDYSLLNFGNSADGLIKCVTTSIGADTFSVVMTQESIHFGEIIYDSYPEFDSKGSCLHKNTGINYVVLALNFRQLWINNKLHLDLTTDWVLNSQNMLNQNITCHELMNAGNTKNAVRNNVFQGGHVAEMIYYGYNISNNDRIGVTNWLNDKYGVF